MVYEFKVIAEVEDNGTDWANDPYRRTPRDFATAALWAASLPDAAHLDGYADLPADVQITWIGEAD